MLHTENSCKEMYANQAVQMQNFYLQTNILVTYLLILEHTRVLNHIHQPEHFPNIGNRNAGELDKCGPSE